MGERILVVRIAALGDIAVTSTVVARIRAELPDAHVTWLTGRQGRDLVELFDGVDEIVTIDEHALLRGSIVARMREIWRTWKALAGRRFDRILLYHADARYRVLLWPVRARRTHSLVLGHNMRFNRFRGDECARLLADDRDTGPALTRYELADVRERLPVPMRETRRPLVALVPGGARNVLRDDALRRWPVESYRLLAERLLRRGIDVALVGGTTDAWVRPHFAGVPVRDEIASGSLIHTLAILRDCDAVVTHDTGPLHLARLVRTPIIALFGPTDPRSVVGDDSSITVLWGGEHLPCRPCYDGRNYARCASNVCLQSVTVAQAEAAVMQRLGSTTVSLMRGESATTSSATGRSATA